MGIVGLGAGLLIIIVSILVGVIVSDFGFSAKWEVGKVKGYAESDQNQSNRQEQTGYAYHKKNRK